MPVTRRSSAGLIRARVEPMSEIGQNAENSHRPYDSNSTQRAGLGITLALNHAAVGRERIVVHDDRSQIRLTLDHKDAHAIELRSASPHGKHHRAGPHRDVNLTSLPVPFVWTIRERDDQLLESPVGLLGPS